MICHCAFVKHIHKSLGSSCHSLEAFFSRSVSLFYMIVIILSDFNIYVFGILRDCQNVFQHDWISVLLYPCKFSVQSVFWNFNHSFGCVVVYHCGFKLHLLDDVHHLYMCLSIICISSLAKCLFKVFVHFLFGCFLCYFFIEVTLAYNVV